ncbi:Lrp/AsnC family transcriptional regulator [Candidatus Woesearchaeota archaeon]|nr:Lrp/AsnC family transcriptional regulator [Candidatus Woesearchaeota archaeon]
MKIDQTDRKILSILVENSRLSYRQIAKKINVSAATVLNRIRKLEENKIIKNYSSLIDHNKIGFEITAIIEIKLHKGIEHVGDKVYNELKANPYIISLYSVTGPYDVIAVTKFRDREELNIFIEKMASNENIEDTNTKYVLNTLKESSSIKIDHPIFSEKII